MVFVIIWMVVDGTVSVTTYEITTVNQEVVTIHGGDCHSEKSKTDIGVFAVYCSNDGEFATYKAVAKKEVAERNWGLLRENKYTVLGQIIAFSFFVLLIALMLGS